MPAIAASIGIVVIAVGYCVYIELEQRRHGTIIPEYEPPSGVSPALAAIIVEGKVTSNAWSSLMLDLAARGFVTVSTDDTHVVWFARVFFLLMFYMCSGLLVYIIAGGSIAAMAAPNLPLSARIIVLLVFAPFAYVLLEVCLNVIAAFGDYHITQTEKDIAPLQNFEQRCLAALFGLERNKQFSTRDLMYVFVKSMGSRTNQYHEMIRTIENTLTAEAASEGLLASAPQFGSSILPFGIVLAILFAVAVPYAQLFPSLVMPGASVIVACFLVLGIRLRPRLSEKALSLRSHLLGFKLYLSKAERFRLKQLTPELFEQYLPYAVALGVEKNWARSFNQFHLSSQWFAITRNNDGTPVQAPAPSESFEGLVHTLNAVFR